MNKQNSLSSISKYRSPIMGMAIIWVVMFHYRLQAPILSVISNYGYAGVDFFMFLSAFGLYYSMSKNDNVMMFYKKRFLRIFPTYFIIGFLCTYFLYQKNVSITEFLWVYSTLGYFTDGEFGGWFIPSIVVLYVAFPFLYHTIMKRDDMRLFGFLMTVVFFLVGYYVVFENSNMTFTDSDRLWKHVLLLYRLPVFFMGFFTAHVLLNKKKEKVLWLGAWAFAAVGVGFYCMKTTMTVCLSTSLVSLLLLYVLAALANKTGNCKILINVMGGVGKASLEIYMIHQPVIAALKRMFPIPFAEHYDSCALLTLLLVCVIGISAHKILSKIYAKIW